MQRVSEVDRRRARRKVDDLALRREHVRRVVQARLARALGPRRARDLVAPREQLAQPGDLLLERSLGPCGLAGLLVVPVRGDAEFGLPVHLLGADLHFQGLPGRPEHRGMQRLVEVPLRPRDVVVELPRDRLPQVVHHAQRAVAVLDAGDDHAQRAHVVQSGKIDALGAHLVPDRVDVLRAAVDLGPHARLLQLARERRDRAGDVSLALGALLVEHLRDLLVELGLEKAEREVLKLPFELPDAQAIGERRVDVERLARVFGALRAGVLGEPAQGLGAAGEAYEHHAHVLGHSEHHLAQRLVLLERARARRDAQPVELLDSRREPGDLLAEGLAQPLDALQVLRRGEQHSRGAPGAVEPDGGEVRAKAERVRPGRLARGQRLPGVERLRELERAREERALGTGKPFGQRLERGGAVLRVQLDNRDHAGILLAR